MEQRGCNLGGQDKFGSFINTKALQSRWSEWQHAKDVGGSGMAKTAAQTEMGPG